MGFLLKLNFILLFAILFGTHGWISIGQAGETKKDDRPNIIVIFTDDHGYPDLTCQGILKDVKTPFIDSLAEGGVRMTHGYVTAPQCVPSRAGLLTGKYQNRFGVEANKYPMKGFNKELTIAEHLKKSGYKTGMSGKWHLGPLAEITKHGFDEVYANYAAGGQVWATFNLQGTPQAPGLIKNTNYHIDGNSKAACAFIKKYAKTPFFFYCAHRAPHVPLDAPKKYLNRFPQKMPRRRQQALAMLSAIDDGVGEILQTLREEKIEKKTLIFFLSDNGAPLKIHKHDAPGGGPGWDGSLNTPLNGEKGMLSEGGIRIPYIAYWKGTLPAGKVYDHPVTSLDITATSVALARIKSNPKLDGVNLIPYLSGHQEGLPHSVLYWRWISQAAIRKGNWKLLIGGNRKYLFDLSTDSEEKKNLISKHPDLAASMLKELESWSQELQPKGLEKTMASTWNRFFDFYLDGKPAPPPPKNVSRNRSKDKDAKIKGWVFRNCNPQQSEVGISLKPRKAKNQRPFLAFMGIDMKGPLQATMEFKTDTPGQAGFSWRKNGQRDFTTDNESVKSVDKGDWQTLSVKLDEPAKIIHVRALLPKGKCQLRSITLKNLKTKEMKSWSFQSPKSERKN